MADGLEALAGPVSEVVILQSFGVGGLPGGASGPLARAMESWLEAGKTIVMMTQVLRGQRHGGLSGRLPGEGKVPAHGGIQYDAGAATAKLMWALGQTRESGQVRRLFEQPVQFDLIR